MTWDFTSVCIPNPQIFPLTVFWMSFIMVVFGGPSEVQGDDMQPFRRPWKARNGHFQFLAKIGILDFLEPLECRLRVREAVSCLPQKGIWMQYVCYYGHIWSTAGGEIHTFDYTWISVSMMGGPGTDPLKITKHHLYNIDLLKKQCKNYTWLSFKNLISIISLCILRFLEAFYWQVQIVACFVQ